MFSSVVSIAQPTQSFRWQARNDGIAQQIAAVSISGGDDAAAAVHHLAAMRVLTVTPVSDRGCSSALSNVGGGRRSAAAETVQCGLGGELWQRWWRCEGDDIVVDRDSRGDRDARHHSRLTNWAGLSVVVSPVVTGWLVALIGVSVVRIV